MKKEKTTKSQKVLDHLQKNGAITSIEAIDLYGATRLSAIIYNLRKKGYVIETKMLETIDRYGNPCHYGKYILYNQ